MGKKARSVMTIRVVTYNLLAPELCRSSYFVNCPVHALRRDQRWKALQSKLEFEMDRQAVICLQEVSHTWAEALAMLCQRRQYFFVPVFGGSDYAGQMGPALAFPVSQFKLEKLKIARCTELKPWPQAQQFAKLGWLSSLWSSLVAPTESVWDRVRNRYNKIIMSKLRHIESDRVFCIANYHMPCDFNHPDAMLIHVSIASQAVQSFSGSLPVVFCGDFNSRPVSAGYELLTTGSISDEHRHLVPERQVGSTWTIEPLKWTWKSAYGGRTGREPAFTNYSQTVNDTKPFADCIDYIFHSDHFSVVETLALPSSTDSFATVLPTASEPSDHLMIAASLTLK